MFGLQQTSKIIKEKVNEMHKRTALRTIAESSLKEAPVNDLLTGAFGYCLFEQLLFLLSRRVSAKDLCTERSTSRHHTCISFLFSNVDRLHKLILPF